MNPQISTASVDTDPPEDGLLQQFLDRRDVKCPACGYNLRSAAGRTCPECGGQLALSLDSPDPLTRRRGLLILLFAWLLLAGSMNAVRSGRQVHRMLTQASQVVWIGNTGQSGSLPFAVRTLRTSNAWNLSSELSVTTDNDLSAEPAEAIEPAGDEEVVVDGQRHTVDEAIRSVEARLGTALVAPDLQLAVTPFAPSPRPAWSSVSWSSWAHLGGWSALALLATIGLSMVFWHHRRPVTTRRARLLLAMAWLSFGGYFVYHGARFVGEVV
jgi:hypothetical protein